MKQLIFNCATGEQQLIDLTPEQIAEIEDAALANIPEEISDRQFFQGLAEEGLISWEEAEAAVGPGTIPGELLNILTEAIPDPIELARARVKVTGAKSFLISDPLVPMVRARKGWSDKRLREFWEMCSGL